MKANKSVLTNLSALALVGLGAFSPVLSEQIFTAGIFALSGALTNWLAVYMLFEKVPFLYGSGVVPTHFEEFKTGIHHLVMSQFFTEENLEKTIGTWEQDGVLQEKMDAAIENLNYDSMFQKLKTMIMESGLGSMLGFIGGAAALDGFKAPFKEKAREFITEEVHSPAFQKALFAGGESRENYQHLLEKVDAIVQARLDELTPQMVKEIVQEMIQKHLGWLVVWGGVFGGLIGLLISFF